MYIRWKHCTSERYLLVPSSIVTVSVGAKQEEEDGVETGQVSAAYPAVILR